MVLGLLDTNFGQSKLVRKCNAKKLHPITLKDPNEKAESRLK